jgi:hypothetical protein
MGVVDNREAGHHRVPVKAVVFAAAVFVLTHDQLLSSLPVGTTR